MIKFFRKIKRDLLSQGNTGGYIKYAIGEIILVVIGILIAIQVNNWYIEYENRNLEKQYLSGLITDMRVDSVAIANIKLQSDEQVRRKRKLYRYLEGQAFPNDSIAYYFTMQWGMSVNFNPITTTFDELTSTGRISVIQDPEIRKKIITIYNTYETFNNGGLGYYERHRAELRKLAFKVPRVIDVDALENPTPPDIITALENEELRNAVLANYAVTVNDILNNLQQENEESLYQIKEYLSGL